MKYLKNIGFSILYSTSSLVLLTFIITIFNYFNIINYDISNILLKIVLFISFFIGSFKFNNKNKKLLKGSYIILINLLIVLIFSLFNKFNMINFIIVLISSILGYYLKNKN